MNESNYSYQAVRQRGFALVLALSLMAFVLLLVISLSTLVRVNYISAVNQRDLTSARQNALLGLNVALGELQKALGPDQRISTTAVALDTATGDDDDDDYDSDTGTLSTDGVISKRQHWTGVWNGASRDETASIALRRLFGGGR